MKIGFIGLGHMGNPMVKNLLKAGFDVLVYDIDSRAEEALLQHGASSTNLAEMAKNTDIIFIMLQSNSQVKETCLQPQGLFANAKKDLLIIDSSSIDLAATEMLHKEASEAGIAFLDAPVSGGVTGAAAGTLTIMVGGETEHFKRAKPILEKLGKKIIHAGPAGMGQAAKICNNMILGISMVAVSEGFTLADKLGLDLNKFFEIASNSSAQCWSMTTYCPVPGILENVPANKNFQPGFMAKMMLKDLMLAMHAAESVNATTPLGAVSSELYSLFVNHGHGEMDFSGIIKMIASEI